MKVLYDHQMFSHQKIGGVSKYFAEVLRNLPTGCWETTTIFSENQYVKDFNLFDTISLPGGEFKGKGRLRIELGIPYTIYRLAKKDYDVYHQTHYELFSMIGIGKKPMVTTIHDLNFFSQNFNRRLQIDTIKSCTRANKIIAITENTKKDLMKIIGVPEHKIEVIYHGIEDCDLYSIPKERLFDFEYVLYVGNRFNEFKNFSRLVEAFSIVSKSHKDIHLVCSGHPFTQHEVKMFNELGISDRCSYIFATETQMKQLYRDAVCFVYPSVSEGFGMPLLEAMQCGCPNVLANASCFPEIAQDAAVFFDPLSPKSIAKSINDIIEDANLRNEIIDLGWRRVAEFSWKKTADLHYKLYESLC